MERHFYSSALDPAVHEAAIVTSMTIRQLGPHDHVSIWNRGALAGELCLVAGDGEALAWALGLVEVEEG